MNAPALSYFPNFVGDMYHLQDPVVIKALFDHFRGSKQQGLFQPTSSIGKFLEILQEIYPHLQFSDDDVMLSCSEEKSHEYRSRLFRFMKPSYLEQHQPMIEQQAISMLKEWAEQTSRQGSVDLVETNFFSASVIAKIAFGSLPNQAEVARAVYFINQYMFLKQVGKPSDAKEREYQAALEVFRTAIDTALRNDPPLFSDSNSPSSEPEKKAMAFLLFFAGQEATGFLAAQLLLHLAQNSSLQQRLRLLLQQNDLLYGSEIEKFIYHMMAERAPAYGLARRVADREGSTDLCLEYILDGEIEKRKFIFPRGSRLVARMMDASHRVLVQRQPTADETAPLNSSLHPALSPDQWSGFGSGKHLCPGRQLALREVKTLLRFALQSYQLTTESEQRPAVVGHVTLQFAKPVFIQVRPL